jgi:DNA-directed RNA polymerase subunit RPC12/RpoP
VGNLAPAFVNTKAKRTRPAKVNLEGFKFDPSTRKLVCAKCGGDFVGKYEAGKHVKLAARCTGEKMKVECFRCGSRVYASPSSRERHFGSKKCKKGQKKGTPIYTVENAFANL